MARKKRKIYKKAKSSLEGSSKRTPRSGEIEKGIRKISERILKIEERMGDLEVYVNLLTRLMATICIEKLGMRVGVFKRLIKKAEKEAIRDSQIMQLESLYKLSHDLEKKGPASTSESQDDPWDEIS